MLTSKEIRRTFLQYFESKGHDIVPSAPVVNKDDPSLMFINAGMNPFKDFSWETQPKECENCGYTKMFEGKRKAQ